MPDDPLHPDQLDGEQRFRADLAAYLPGQPARPRGLADLLRAASSCAGGGRAPNDLEGPGPTELVDTFTDPAAVLAAVNRLLQPRPTAADHHGRREAAASCAG
jgi:hypothetical protein